ncbi:MAG: SBBP repeat-containing protein [Flavobacteriales bacterium]|nr:SBBP repeat-containing protein [Flavobacteriales bacterium]
MSVPRSLAQTCALDVFVANDQSGSVSAIENTQSRQFISALFNGMQPWGTGAGQSRIAIADWDNPGVWQQYSFPVAGQNYTDLLADVLAYQTAPRTLFGGTDPYTALLNCYQQLNQTPIPGRVARPVIVLMTDAACSQVPATFSTLATQVKNAGVYLIVVAIEAASSCPSLAGTNVASPGGYFSAPTYAQLSQANVSLVQQMINAGCTGSVDPSYDLAIALDDFTASGCLSPPATYAVDYTVNNGPGADFVGNLVISFYSADPALPTTSLLAVQNLGAVSIPMNGSYSGSFSNAALGATNTLFAIVNFDGSAAGNAPPVTGYYEPDMVEPLEYVTFNNLSNQANRVNDPVSCPPQATITGNIVTGGLGCSDRATYQITICNTGDATAYITPTLPIAVPGAVVITSATQPGNYVDSLDWATYYGGTLLEEGRAVATDPAGNVYLAGTTRSTAAIATAGAHQVAAPGNRNAFLAKFNTAGVRLWATYYGGPDPDEGYGVATDALGNVYLVGLTESTTGIATAGTYQTANAGGEDAFIVKFNSAGVRQWASYFGGNDTDQGYSVATDAAGNVYLAGMTEGSTGLASAGAHQAAFAGVSDQFLVKFNGTNGTRLWSTYYGGADEEIDGNVACDPSNNVYLTGQTVSPTGIAAGGWDNALAGNDIYLAKFNSAGVRQWGTYYGGPDDEDQGSVACDAAGNVYLGGTTDSDAGIAYNALHQGFRAGSKDGFVAQFDGAGTLQWCNYVGGSDNDELRDVAVRSSGDVLVTGSTNSLDNIATLGSYQTVPDGVSDDAFLVKLHSDGSLDWGTYYGGLDDEDGRSVAVDVAGNVYICGTTPSTTLIATPGAHQTTYSDNDDAYLAKFGERELPLILFPDECILREYIVDYSAVAAGTYSLSLGLAATPFAVSDPPPNVMPDQNFNAGTYTGIDGFNGALHPRRCHRARGRYRLSARRPDQHRGEHPDGFQLRQRQLRAGHCHHHQQQRRYGEQHPAAPLPRCVRCHLRERALRPERWAQHPRTERIGPRIPLRTQRHLPPGRRRVPADHQHSPGHLHLLRGHQHRQHHHQPLRTDRQHPHRDQRFGSEQPRFRCHGCHGAHGAGDQQFQLPGLDRFGRQHRDHRHQRVRRRIAHLEHHHGGQPRGNRHRGRADAHVHAHADRRRQWLRRHQPHGAQCVGLRCHRDLPGGDHQCAVRLWRCARGVRPQHQLPAACRGQHTLRRGEPGCAGSGNRGAREQQRDGRRRRQRGGRATLQPVDGPLATHWKHVRAAHARHEFLFAAGLSACLRRLGRRWRFP